MQDFFKLVTQGRGRIAKTWHRLQSEAAYSKARFAAWMQRKQAKHIRQDQDIERVKLEFDDLKKAECSPGTSGPPAHPPGTIPL